MVLWPRPIHSACRATEEELSAVCQCSPYWLVSSSLSYSRCKLRTRRFVKDFDLQWPSEASDTHGPVAVILPLRGADPSLSACLQGLVHQRFGALLCMSFWTERMIPRASGQRGASIKSAISDQSPCFEESVADVRPEGQCGSHKSSKS